MRYLRRLDIVVKYTKSNPLDMLQKETRRIRAELQNSTPDIDFVHLKFDFNYDRLMLNSMCRNDDDEVRYSGLTEAEKSNATAVVKTWLGLHNVKTVVIEGLSEEEAEAIKANWQSSGPLDKSADLAEMYSALEKHVDGLKFLRWDLRCALKSCERGNLEGFKNDVDATRKLVRQRQEAMKNVSILLYFKDGE